MEQGVPGSQTDPFFELLHPNAARDPPTPPPPPPPPPPPRVSSSSAPSADPEADDLAPEDPSPVHEISPSYEFYLTHSSKPSEHAKSDDVDANSEDNPPYLKNGSSSTASEGNLQQGSASYTAKGPDDNRSMEVRETYNEVTMAAIDRTVKNYTDNLLHVLQSVNERVSQLENTVQGLEHMVAGLKSIEGEKHEQSNGRLMQLELLIQEVHTGIQLLHEKHKLEEAKSLLTNVYLDDQKAAVSGISQTSADGWQQPRLAKEEGPPAAAYSEPPLQLAQHPPLQYTPHAQAHYPHAPPQPLPQLSAYASSQNILPQPLQMNGPSNPPPATQLPYLHNLPAQPSAQQVPQPPPPQHPIQATSFHTQQPPQSSSQSAYNLPMEAAAYGHMHSQHHHPPAPATPPSSTYPSDPQQYSAGMHGGAPRQQQPPPPELIYPSPQQHTPVGSQHMYESISGRMGPTANSMGPSSYVHTPPSKPAPPIPMYDASSVGSGYGTPPYRTAQPVPSAPSGGGGGYPRLPTAQPVQHGLPAAAGVSSGPVNRSSLDEVIEKVSAMGFSREQVRGVVRQLTENGQAVDMNMVLDKLMNGGELQQPSRGWFGRR